MTVSLVKASDDTSYAETEDYGYGHGVKPPVTQERNDIRGPITHDDWQELDGGIHLTKVRHGLYRVFKLNARLEHVHGEVIIKQDPDTLAYHVRLDGHGVWSYGMNLWVDARMMAVRLLKIMQECDRGLITFTEALQERDEIMFYVGR